MRLLYTFVFVLTTSVVFSQKTTLIQNINSRANELKHSLNRSGDSLIFKCERTIFEVVVFNEDYHRVHKIRNTEGIVPITDIPAGKFLVEALLRDKLIVMTLLKDEPISLPNSAPLVTDNAYLFGEKIAIQKVAAKSTSKESVGKEKNSKKTDLAVAGKRAKRIRKAIKKPKLKSKIKRVRIKKPVSSYWIVYTINQGTSSEKTLKLADQNDVNRLIRKIEADKKTKTGHLNELTVWKVYDATEFIKHKRQNKADYMNIASESFKLEPYFKNVNKPGDL